MAGTLLFYDPLAGQGTFYQFDSLGGVTPVRTHSSWRSDWKQTVQGQFSGPDTISVLFYDGAGTGEFYAFDSQHDMKLLGSHTGWVSPAGRPWTHIVAGYFSDTPYTGLLFYDSAGTGAFYTTDGQGGITHLRTHTGWVSPAGRPWTHIIVTNFISSRYSNLLFYDSAGTGAFYTTDGQGGITHFRTHTGWVSPAGNPWTHISLFGFGFLTPAPESLSVYLRQLLFYDSAGTGAFYTTDAQGGITHLRTHTGWVSPAGRPWTQFVPFLDYPNNPDRGLLFYDGAGTVAFYKYDGQGGITLVRADSNLPSGRIIYSTIAPYSS
jgi:hypothetical protein